MALKDLRIAFRRGKIRKIRNYLMTGFLVGEVRKIDG